MDFIAFSCNAKACRIDAHEMGAKPDLFLSPSARQVISRLAATSNEIEGVNGARLLTNKPFRRNFQCVHVTSVCPSKLE